jgi:hypothetical protein
MIGSNAEIGVVCAVLGGGLIAVAARLGRGPTGNLILLLNPVLLLAIFGPLLWMALQIAPLPFGWFSDPVWASTSAALKLPMWGSISINIGGTLLSILRYAAVAAAALITAGLAYGRHSAQRILFILACVSGIVAADQLAVELGYLRANPITGGLGGWRLTNALGIVVCCPALVSIHQKGSKKSAPIGFLAPALTGALGMVAALIVCTLGLVIAGEFNMLFAGLIGVGIPMAILLIREGALTTWGKLLVCATGIIVVSGFVVVISSNLEQGTDRSTTNWSSAELMLADAPVFGRGAGSMQDLLPVYRQVNQNLSPESVTAAATIAVEMGATFLWIFILALIVGAAILVRASLRRRRDYIYPAMGAGILLTIWLATFVNQDALSFSASLLASSALGLAFAQAQSSKMFVAWESASYAELNPVSHGRSFVGGWKTRIGCALFGLALAAGACWLLIPEIAELEASDTNSLDRAASLARLRGDLWAKSAMASAASLLENPVPSSDESRVRDRLINALRNSPYRGDVWLLLARLVGDYGWKGFDLPALLKMVYYTAASDLTLIPGRLKLALGLNRNAIDSELEDLVGADVNLILRRSPELKPALVQAYKAATPDGRSLAEYMVGQTDPDFLKTLRASEPPRPPSRD